MQLENRPHGGSDDFGVEKVRCGFDQGQVPDPKGEHGPGDGAQITHTLGLNEDNMISLMVQGMVILFKNPNRVGVAPLGKFLNQAVVLDDFNPVLLAVTADDMNTLVFISLRMEYDPLDLGRSIFKEFNGGKNPE
jgi:hypothetical protein